MLAGWAYLRVQNRLAPAGQLDAAAPTDLPGAGGVRARIWCDAPHVQGAPCSTCSARPGGAATRSVLSLSCSRSDPQGRTDEGGDPDNPNEQSFRHRSDPAESVTALAGVSVACLT